MGTPRSFGDYVTAARERRGYSIRHVAAQVGVAPSTILRIEDGTHALPHPDLFLALIDVLDLDITTAIRLVEPYGRLCAEVARRQTHGITGG